MKTLEFYLDNVLVNPPKNYRETSIEVNYEDGEFKSQQLTITDYNFVRENIDKINQWITDGYIFEGIPLKIVCIDIDGTTTTFFDGYLDISDQSQFDEYGIVAKAKPKYSIDWLNDVAVGFSFDYLYNTGVIKQSDFTDIPYVISSIPDYEKVAITIIGLTLIIQSLITAGQDLQSAIEAVSSGSFDWGNLFTLIGAILKFSSLVIASLALIKRIFAITIQNVKYHKGISIRKLFERGCEKLGLIFDSTIIDPKDHILPSKFTVPKNPNNLFGMDILGAFEPNEFPQYGYPNGTFADFIIKMKDLYNGKVLFDGNILRFERKDFTLAVPSYQIPDVLNTKYTLNSNDFTSNFFALFQTDVTESNTITRYLGTSYQVTVNPISIKNNSSYVLMKGLKQINLPYALGKRKLELTTVEKIFDTLNEVIDATIGNVIKVLNVVIEGINFIIDAINSFINFFEDVGSLVGFSFDIPDIPDIPTIPYEPLSDLINNRIGMLLLERDSFVVDKLLRLESDGKLSEVQPSAKEIYEKYYIIDYFTQYKFQEWNQIPFTLGNFNSIRNNPSALLQNDEKCDILSAKFNIFNDRADLVTRNKYIYTQNLKYNYAEPTGE